MLANIYAGPSRSCESLTNGFHETFRKWTTNGQLMDGTEKRYILESVNSWDKRLELKD